MYVINPTKSKKSVGLPVGTYRSTVLEIMYHPEYAFHDAILVKYRLTAEDGTTYSFEEVFWVDDYNARWAQFSEYLADEGIENDENDLPILVGFEEVVELKKRKGYHRPGIVSRDVVKGGQDA